MRFLKVFLPLCLALLLAPACRVVAYRSHHHPHHVPPGHIKRVHHVPPGHFRHVHGHNCGHVYRNGAWVSVKLKVR